MGPIAPVYLGSSVLSLVTKTKLLGLIVDQKFTWVPNVLETEKFCHKTRFAQTLSFFAKSNFKRLILKWFFQLLSTV